MARLGAAAATGFFENFEAVRRAEVDRRTAGRVADATALGADLEVRFAVEDFFEEVEDFRFVAAESCATRTWAAHKVSENATVRKRKQIA
jgi:hypothetical protein